MNMTECCYTMSNLELQTAINEARRFLFEITKHRTSENDAIVRDACRHLEQLVAEQVKRSKDAVVKND